MYTALLRSLFLKMRENCAVVEVAVDKELFLRRDLKVILENRNR